MSTPWGTHAPGLVARALIAAARHSPLGRGSFRRTMAGLIGGPVDVELHGARYRLRLDNSAPARALLLHGRYNAEEIAFLAGGLQPGDAFIDIGCNVGTYALPLARRVGATGQVLAIDANPAMIAAISFNAEASGLPQVRPIHAAVGDREAEVALDLSANDMGGVAVAEGAGGIPMRPLLHILAEAGITRIAALKIDIEGHEDSALVPFFAAAPESLLPARIVIERERQGRTRQPGSNAAFAAHGYRLAGQTRGNAMWQRG